MTKFRLYLDKDKETAWINQMAQDGYALTGFFAGFYQFEACEPGEYIYQIDFGSKFATVSDDYRDFMQENGIEIVCLWGYWIILRKRASEGDFILYTDVDSNIEHYTKILKMFKAATIIELLCFMIEVFAAMNGAAIGFFGMLFIGIIIVAMMCASLSTKRLINELKERKGEPAAKGLASGNVSPVLIAGLLLNAGATALHNSTLSPTVVTITQVAAIIIMLIGIYQSRNVFTK